MFNIIYKLYVETIEYFINNTEKLRKMVQKKVKRLKKMHLIAVCI